MVERFFPSGISVSSVIESTVRAHPKAALLADRAVRSLERVVVVEEHRGVLDEARRHLETGSLVVYFGPHTTALEPLEINDQFVIPELRRGPDQTIAWFTSGKFTGHVPGSDMGIFSELKTMFEETRGVTLLPLVQYYLVEEGYISEQDANRINRDTWDEAIELLGKPGTVVGIAPEGTRAQTGGLQRGHSATGRLITSHPNVAALPLYMEGAHRIQPPKGKGIKSMHPWARVKIRVGPLITKAGLDELSDNFAWRNPAMKRFKPSDVLMMHLLNRPLLPWVAGVDPRGDYSWDNVVDLGMPSEFASDSFTGSHYSGHGIVPTK